MEIRDRSLDTLLSLMLRVSSLVLQLGLATELKKVSTGWRRQISDGHGAFSSQGRIDDLLGHGPSVPPVSPVFVICAAMERHKSRDVQGEAFGQDHESHAWPGHAEMGLWRSPDAPGHVCPVKVWRE